MNSKITTLLNNFADEHNKLQLEFYKMAAISNDLGFPGASKWFQIQAQDEVLHARRIYNYLMSTNAPVTITVLPLDTHNLTSLFDLMTRYSEYKKSILKTTYQLIAAANAANEFLTVKFLDWFLIDFYEEISLADDYLDMIKMSNNDYYGIDKKLQKRQEPVTAVVIQPYAN